MAYRVVEFGQQQGGIRQQFFLSKMPIQLIQAVVAQHWLKI